MALALVTAAGLFALVAILLSPVVRLILARFGSTDSAAFAGVSNVFLSAMLVATTVMLYRLERDRDRSRFRVLDASLRTMFNSGNASYFLAFKIANMGAASSIERVTVRIGRPWRTWRRFPLRVGSPSPFMQSPRSGAPGDEYRPGDLVSRGAITEVLAHFEAGVRPAEILALNGQTCRLFVKPLLGETASSEFECDSGVPAIEAFPQVASSRSQESPKKDG
ncbi:MAG: hypothetical protein HYT80_05240 [Euryarchaeota archaeon]|nr:hypothetical protein [Euryarchaeota archaeon]